MRIGVVVALLGVSVASGADPGRPSSPLEATGFVGVDSFGNNVALGDSMFAEQRPTTSPLFGARLSYFALRRDHVELGGEAELSLTPTWTGYGFDGPRMSYFSPVVGWRGAVVLRFEPHAWLRPHVLVGGGGETVLSTSPYMTRETDPLFYIGAGVTLPMNDSWRLRVDVREGFLPAAGGGTTTMPELMIGLGSTFELAHGRGAPPERPPPGGVVDATVDRERDRDGDGIPDWLDKCPDQPETVNGIADDDGCPELDPDGDGIVGAADKCPNAPEDFDQFQDQDGCPDPDNDGDGILDARDACPNEPETVNGWQDEDGCPDKVPDDIVAALQRASAIRFESGRARLTAAAKLLLDKPIAVLSAHGTLKITITAHPDPDAELAKKRALAVKWYIVEQGVAEDQISTEVGAPVVPKGPTIELALTVRPPP